MTVEAARDRDENTEAVLRIRSEDHEERWLLSEVWWAQKFLPPSYGELVSWSLRALPWAIALHIARQAGVTAPRASGWARVYQVGASGVLLVLALALSPVVAAVLAASLLVGLLPIPRLRSAILAAQGALVRTIGDSLAFVDSPVRAALIQTAVRDAIAATKVRSERTVVLAHSQGAAVVVAALGGLLDPDFMRRLSEADDPRDDTLAVPDALITFGAGTNQLAALRSLSVPAEMWDARLGIRAAVNVSFLMAASLLWVYLGDASLRQVAFAAGASILSLAGFSGAIFLVAAVLRRLRRLPGEENYAGSASRGVAAWFATIALLWIVSVVPLFVLMASYSLPVPATYVAMSALVVMALFVTGTFHWSARWDVSVRMPPGLPRWVDIYASSDPVSNGPTRTTDDGNGPETIQVWNLGSTFRDHTSYWVNAEGFVLRVVQVCVQTAGSRFAPWIPWGTPALDRRAAWRVGSVRLGRVVLTTSWVALGIAFWVRHGERFPRIDPPPWLPSGLVQLAELGLFVVVLAVGAMASSSLLTVVWLRWVGGEQQAALDGAAVEGGEWGWLFAMSAFLWVVAGVGFLIVRDGPSDAVAELRAHWIAYAVAIVALGAASSYALLRLFPAPPGGHMERER